MSVPYHLVEFEGELVREYESDFILSNPIEARRVGRCKRTFTEREAIMAPALKGCRCFWCGGELRPLQKGGPATVEDVARAKGVVFEELLF